MAVEGFGQPSFSVHPMARSAAFETPVVCSALEGEEHRQQQAAGGVLCFLFLLRPWCRQQEGPHIHA